MKVIQLSQSVEHSFTMDQRSEVFDMTISDRVSFEICTTLLPDPDSGGIPDNALRYYDDGVASEPVNYYDDGVESDYVLYFDN